MPSNSKLILLTTTVLFGSLVVPTLAAPAPLSSETELVEREPLFGLIKTGLGLLSSVVGGRRKKRDLDEVDELALRQAFDALYDRDVTFAQNGDLVERQPLWWGLAKAGLSILGSLGGKKKKRDLTEDEELFMRELMEYLDVDMRDYDDSLDFDARDFNESEDLSMREFEALEFEAREIDSEIYDVAERDFEWESYDARDYEDLEEMD